MTEQATPIFTETVFSQLNARIGGFIVFQLSEGGYAVFGCNLEGGSHIYIERDRVLMSEKFPSLPEMIWFDHTSPDASEDFVDADPSRLFAELGIEMKPIDPRDAIVLDEWRNPAEHAGRFTGEIRIDYVGPG